MTATRTHGRSRWAGRLTLRPVDGQYGSFGEEDPCKN